MKEFEMKLDQIVLKRFQELVDKAQQVEATRIRKDYLEFIDSEKFHEWGTSAMSLLRRVFGEESVHYTNFNHQLSKFDHYATEFEKCRGIFKAAKEDYEGGYLFNLKSLVSAEVLDDVLEQATHLLEADHKDPACVVARVALETTLKKLCDLQGISHNKLDRMNADLCKAGLYNVGMQKQIIAWADRGNNAAHGNWDEYTADDVKDMIAGVNRFIAEYL
jgi:hypothetical protein